MAREISLPHGGQEVESNTGNGEGQNACQRYDLSDHLPQPSPTHQHPNNAIPYWQQQILMVQSPVCVAGVGGRRWWEGGTSFQHINLSGTLRI